MRASSSRRLRRFGIWVLLELLVAAGLLVFAALADTTPGMHKPSTVGCYCGCAMAKTATGCAKVCDLPKFAARRWAITCTKPHASAPTESPNAQPHLPHYSKSERASN